MTTNEKIVRRKLSLLELAGLLRGRVEAAEFEELAVMAKPAECRRLQR